MKKKIIVSITLAVLLISGALLANNWVGRVSADSGTTTDALTLTKGGRGGSDEDLAAALGITIEELTTAEQKAFTSAVDAALKAETITASQAETLKAGSASFRRREIMDEDVSGTASIFCRLCFAFRSFFSRW